MIAFGVIYDFFFLIPSKGDEGKAGTVWLEGHGHVTLAEEATILRWGNLNKEES